MVSAWLPERGPGDPRLYRPEPLIESPDGCRFCTVGPAVFQQVAAKRSTERKVFLQGLALGKAMGLSTQGTTGGQHIAQGCWVTVLLQPVLSVCI